MRALARSRPRSADGSFLPIDPARRARIVAETPERIRRGQTTTQIALEHGIPPRTLRSWLLGDETVENARGEFLAQELSIQIEAIENADSPLPLARAREAFRAWAWIAERREARLYGPKQEVTHITADLGERLRRARERVVNSVDNSGVIEHTGVMSNQPALPNPQAGTEALLPPEGPIQSKK